MNTLSEAVRNQESKIKRTMWLVASTLAIIVVALGARNYWIDAGTSTEIVASAAKVEPVATRSASLITMSASTSPQNIGGFKTTYQPGVPHSIRQITGQFEIGRKNPHWWLYARSPEDAAWLDKFGYPTPGEEARLAASSDAELLLLAQNGDANAKVHSAVRLAKGAFTGNDPKKIEIAANTLGALALEGGPYAAAKAMTVFGEVVREYYQTPEGQRTALQKKAIQELSWGYESAYAMSLAYGDYAAGFVRNYTVAPPTLGVVDRKNIIGADITQSLANQSRMRIEQGLPPLTLDPRPIPPEVVRNGLEAYQTPTLVLERY